MANSLLDFLMRQALFSDMPPALLRQLSGAFEDKAADVPDSYHTEEDETMAIPIPTSGTVTLNQVPRQISVTEIVRHGEKLVLPANMTLDQAQELIARRKKYEGERTEIRETFNAFPWDGAVALNHVLNNRYGWSPAIPTPGFWSDNPPQLVSVEIGPGEVTQVPWGRFLLPNVEGFIDTAAAEKNGMVMMQIVANVLRRDEHVVRDLFDELRDYISKNSIYRGKAVRIRFNDEDGDPIELPTPTFMRVDNIDESKLVLPEAVERAVLTNLFVPITRPLDCLANGIPVKRGVLLGGTYGTGKTLTASVAAKKAVQAGNTFLYIQRADELAKALAFAAHYQSPACVVFCEDIDRTTDGERTVEMDDILNTIDGIDSKTNNIIVVLTTNNIRNIHPAMLRPGRLDAVIEVVPPDARAAERLVRVYAGESLSADEDIGVVGKDLDGQIPAVIAEVVKRAKLAQLAMQPVGSRVEKLTAMALLVASETIKAQVELLKPREKVERLPIDEAVASIVSEAVERAINSTHETTQATHDRVQKIARMVGA